MIIPIPYGKTHLELALPDDIDLTLLEPHETPALGDPLQAARDAIDAVDWSRFAGARTAAIAVNDKTRPVPHQYLLPPLVEKLESIGIAPERITFIIATGSHTPATPGEFPALVTEDLAARCRVVSHNVDDLDNIVRLGLTKYGTVVSVNQTFFTANIKIVVGNIEPHQFAGFSGGAKSAAIGLAGWDTINANHRMMTRPQAGLGIYDDNPVRQDVEDMGRVIGVHLALNVVLNRQKQIVKVLCGQPVSVMRAAIPIVRQVYELPIRAPFDVVVASPGGYPKDINIYQAQKALGHAVQVSREGGAIILAAACSEGSGSARYEGWLKSLAPEERTHAGVIARFTAEGYRVGPHKAFQIARDSVNRHVIWVSDLPDPAFFLMESASTLREAVARVIPACGRRVGVLPYANSTIPTLRKEPIE